jgi:hypothetical protein
MLALGAVTGMEGAMGWAREMVAGLLFGFAQCGGADAATSDGKFYSYTLFHCADVVSSYSAEMSARAANYGKSDVFYNYTYGKIYHYVSGWLTAYNALTPDTYNVVPSGMEGVMLYLDNDCMKHPLNDVDFAVWALIVEVIPSRQTHQ